MMNWIQQQKGRMGSFSCWLPFDETRASCIQEREREREREERKGAHVLIRELSVSRVDALSSGSVVSLVVSSLPKKRK